MGGFGTAYQAMVFVPPWLWGQTCSWLFMELPSRWGGAEGFYKAAFSGVIMAAALLSITACASPSLKRDLDNRSLPGGALQVNFSNGVSP